MAENIWRKTSLFIKIWKGSFWKYFFISELGGKTSLERLQFLSWRGGISTILQSFGRKNPFYEAYEENFHCGALNTKFIQRKYFFHLKLWMKNSRSMELKRVTPIAMHWEKEKLPDFWHSMKLEGKNSLLRRRYQRMQCCNTLNRKKKSYPDYARKFTVVRIYHC